MSAAVRLSCDCSDGKCSMDIVLPVQSTSDARSSAKNYGWDCDVIYGTTIDWAPGHQPQGDAA